MTYLGLLVDCNAVNEVGLEQVDWPGGDVWERHMMCRVGGLKTWPGQVIAEELVCGVVQ